jgi:hypothetical protein
MYSATLEKYTTEEVLKILNGYLLLDENGHYSKLLKRIAACKRCSELSPDHFSLPFNTLVRGLPLQNFSTLKDRNNYRIRIQRDDTFLRNILKNECSHKEVYKKIKSAKFSIGIFPWLDRCMLYRKSPHTTLMILGIDYKHFPLVCREKNNQNFPLDSYRKSNNIWNKTWRLFWRNILNKHYDDRTVNKFIALHGVYMTNSMLCFGGSNNPASHHYNFIDNCRAYIEEQIRIVKPRILLSFGNYGCKNAATILLKENPENIILKTLSESHSPITELRNIMKANLIHDCGIPVRYNNLSLNFWAVYQPARATNRYSGDYDVVRTLFNKEIGRPFFADM